MQPTPPLQPLLDALEVPALVFSRPHATHAWPSIAALQQGRLKVKVVATSSYGDLDPYWRALRTARHLGKSKVLVWAAEPGARRQIADAYTKHFGTTFQFVTGREFVEVFQSVDPQLTRQATGEFLRGAHARRRRRQLAPQLLGRFAPGGLLRRSHPRVGVDEPPASL